MKARNQPIERRDTDELFPLLDQLVDEWCDRRALRELRLILSGYPMGSALTDDWNELRTALEDVAALCRDSMLPAERDRVDYALRLVTFILDHRRPW